MGKKKSSNAEIVEDLDAQIAAIESGVMPVGGVTTTTLQGFGDINNITEYPILRAAMASILVKSAAEEKADKLLAGEETVPVIKIEGNTPDQWTALLKNRYVVITNDADLKELKELREEFRQLVTDEEKQKMAEKKKEKLLKKFADRGINNSTLLR